MKSITIFAFMVAIGYANADSAGIVKMTDGLAYGGIPYGSISGMLGKYGNSLSHHNYPQNLNKYEFQRQKFQPQLSPPVIITPNIRAAGLAARRNGPVQIYRLSGVIAPGVVGTVSQIGY